MAFAEITVSPNAPMPKGYKLLRKGYPFMTALCRRKTLAAGQTLYVVRARSRTQGLRAPRYIIDECYKEEEQTRATRRATVAARDASTRSLFETALRLQFPEMPAVDVEQVLQRTLKKRSGRVGRTSKLGTEDKVRLAVTAHVRHMHTDYDKLVRGETSREEARKLVYGPVRSVLARWEGSREKQSATRGEDSRRRRPHTRATARIVSEQSLVSLDGEEDVPETAASSIDDPILISSDSEDDRVDVLIISSDEE
ncbi:hypothetical protein MY11210_006291 [Beauveria gryllotalpidicola]